MFVSSFFDLKATANVIGPTLPKYIVKIMIILPHSFKNGVKFLDKPTVAVALTVSKNISVRTLFVVKHNNIVDKNTIAKDIPATAIDFLDISPVIVLLNKTISFLFFIDVNAVATTNTIVTVLIPPAVPTGDPPININTIHNNADALVKFSWGTVAKPAVLVVIDWKKETWILSYKLKFPIVKGLLYSKQNINIAPINIKNAVATKTILLCKVKDLKHLNFLFLNSFKTLKKSHQTIKTKPPKTINKREIT